MNARGHLSSETIDLLLMSALTGEREETAKSHLGGCTVCQKRWAELNEDKARFEQFVFPRTLEKLEHRLSQRTWSERLWGGRRLWVPALAGALAASLAVTVMWGGKDRTQTEDDVYIGIKGPATLEVVGYRTVTGQFPVKAGSVLKPKDKIRFVVNSGASKYLLIASRDGAGTFTVYSPFGKDRSARLPPGRSELADTVELDEVVGTERLVAVFSDVEVTAEQVRAALANNPADPKIENARILTWEFVKEK